MKTSSPPPSAAKMIACPRENVVLAKLSTISYANASRRMLGVSAAARGTLTTSKRHLRISVVAVVVLANVLSLASAILPIPAVPHQSGSLLDTSVDSNRPSLIPSEQYKQLCLSRGCFFVFSIRKKEKMFEAKD